MVFLADFVNTSISLVSFLLLNISVFLSALLLTRKYFAVANRLDNLISLGILYIAQIVLYQTLLGVLHLLTRLNLLVLALSSFCLVVLISHRDAEFEFAKISKFYREVKRYLRENGFLQASLLICLFIFLHQLFASLLRPPYGGDSLAYHLPRVIDWLQGHSLIIQSSPCWFMPGNSELISLWLIIPFHNDLFVNLQNFPFLFLALFSIYGLCRKIGVDKKWASYGAILLFSAPIVMSQLGTANNDIGILTLFLVSLNYIFCYQKYKKISLILLFSISLGLLLGIKYNAVCYILLLLLIYLLTSRFKIKFIGRDPLILLVGMVMFGGYWYIRNYLFVQNPFAPAQIELFGKELFQGHWRFAWLKSTSVIYHGNYLETSKFLLKALLKWGGVVGFLSLPIIVATSGTVVHKTFHKGGTRRNEIVLSCLASLATLYIFLITPLVVENVTGTLNQITGGGSVRFGMVFLALSCICFSFLLNYVKDSKLSLLGEISLLGIIILNFLLHSVRIMGNKISIFAYYILLIVLLVWQISHLKVIGNKLEIRKMWSLTIVILLIFSLTSFGLIKYRDRARAHIYGNQLFRYFGYTDLYKWFDQNVHGQRVLVTGLRIYPFYGSKLNNEVSRGLGPSKDLHRWKKWLIGKRIDFIVIGRRSEPYHLDFGKFPPVERNLLLFPDILIPVFSDDTAHVYKILKTSPDK